MPDKLTDTEIKKALEEYINFADLEYTNHTSIEVDILKNALDLINRQEEEKQNLVADIERLREIRDLCNTTILEQKEQIEKLKISDASKEECTIKQHGEIKELKAEVEKLNFVRQKDQVRYEEKISTQAETNCTLYDLYDKAIKEVKELEEKLKTAKAKAYKEFADILISEKLAVILLKNVSDEFAIGYKTALIDVEQKAKNLLNELMGDADGEND